MEFTVNAHNVNFAERLGVFIVGHEDADDEAIRFGQYILDEVATIRAIEEEDRLHPCIVFVPHAKYAEIYVKHYGGLALTDKTPAKLAEDNIEAFNEGRCNKLVATPKWCVGWRTARPAVVKFVDDFNPNKALRAQAVERGRPTETVRQIMDRLRKPEEN